MKVLVACEYSGTVREAFRKRGHNAISCDIIPTEIDGPHYQGNIFDILYEDWDIMIAHPPCTYLSNAGARHLYPQKGVLNVERYAKGMEAKEFFMKLWTVEHIPKVCVENPISSKVFEMPEHSQEIQPYEYGHALSKKTRLWLRNLPLLVPTNIVEKKENCHGAEGSWYNRGGLDRQKRRAKFFQGWADAMAEQWGEQ
tara:strand:+ start:121 stop:714 length:594 start_codon:yes stop_codon:yes gene_type:complete